MVGFLCHGWLVSCVMDDWFLVSWMVGLLCHGRLVYCVMDGWFLVIYGRLLGSSIGMVEHVAYV